MWRGEARADNPSRKRPVRMSSGHPSKVCIKCGTSRTKANFAKRQWRSDGPVCRTCAAAEQSEGGAERRQCIQCDKTLARDQFPQKQWGRDRPRCRVCYEFTKASPDTTRRCRECREVLPRQEFAMHQWSKGAEALCHGCRDKVAGDILGSIGKTEVKNLPDDVCVCDAHSLEYCDVCMVDYTLPNRFARKRAALGRELTQDEFEAETKAWQGESNVKINKKICIMDGLPVCPRSGRKLRCPCQEVTYCSKACQKQHWMIHKMTCKAHLKKLEKKKSKKANGHGLTDEQLDNIRIEAFFAENSGEEHSIEECAHQLGEHPLVIGGGSVRLGRDGKQEFVKGDVAKIYMEQLGAAWDGSPRFGMGPYVQRKEPFDWIAKAKAGKSERERAIEESLRASIP